MTARNPKIPTHSVTVSDPGEYGGVSVEPNHDRVTRRSHPAVVVVVAIDGVGEMLITAGQAASLRDALDQYCTD